MSRQNEGHGGPDESRYSSISGEHAAEPAATDEAKRRATHGPEIAEASKQRATGMLRTMGRKKPWWKFW